jgi:hypothetical protein
MLTKTTTIIFIIILTQINSHLDENRFENLIQNERIEIPTYNGIPIPLIDMTNRLSCLHILNYLFNNEKTYRILYENVYSKHLLFNILMSNIHMISNLELLKTCYSTIPYNISEDKLENRKFEEGDIKYFKIFEFETRMKNYSYKEYYMRVYNLKEVMEKVVKNIKQINEMTKTQSERIEIDI